MSEINKIFLKSSINIEYINMNTLCFIDGLVVPSDKYSLTADRFDIYKQSLDSVNLFYNYNKSISYEYNVVLSNTGTIISGIDINGNDLSRANLSADRIMIFVNGKLLSKNQYAVNNNTNEIALFYTIPQNVFQKVIVYVSKANESIQTGTDITYKKIILTDNINLARNDSSNINYDPSVFYVYIYNTSDPSVYSLNNYIPFQYSINSSLIFINGKKLDNFYIECSDKGFKINKKDLKAFTETQERIWNPITQQYDLRTVTYTGEGYSDTIEFYDLGNSTESVNFYNTLGFTTFNYRDSNQKRIPLLYNCIVTFPTISKYVVDNIRTGFFIKENNNIGNGVAIVVDSEFESPQVKCYIQPSVFFTKSTYYYNEYYLEVPNVKSITEYVSDYDKKYKLLPSILEVFQQTLLKEIYDTVNRIRDIRSIDRVDSYHINKLIKLLGMDIDIKTLPLKKRHELLEELNSFYRIVGTKDSLNIFNILQDDLKLVQVDQLFTPSYNIIDYDAPVYYYYDYYKVPRTAISYGGSGYHKYDRLEYLYDINGDQSLYIPYYFTVTSVDSNGSILSIEPDTYEGTEALNSVWSSSTQSPSNIHNQNLNLTTTITTTDYKTRYDYDYGNTPYTQSGVFHVGQELYTDDNAYRFRVSSVNTSGTITGWTKLNGPDYGIDPIVVPSSGFPLVITDTSFNISLVISNTYTGSTTVINDGTPSGSAKSRTLQRGVYDYEIFGGGGSGAAGDTGHGALGDIPTENGYRGYVSSGTFTINSNSAVLNYWVGGGGNGGSSSLRHWWKYNWNASSGGVGYQYGEGKVAWHSGVHSDWAQLVVGGAGGGSSRVYINNIVDKVAQGGQGGGWQNVVSGGLGGNSGGKNGTGSSGGASSYHTGNGWGANGAAGKVIVNKKLYNINTSISGYDSSILVGDVFKTANNEYTVTVTSVSNNTITGTVTSTVPGFSDQSLPLSGTYPLFYVSTAQSAKLNIVSTFNNKSVTYSYGNLNGLTQYLYEGATVVGTISSSGYTTHPANSPTTINVTGNIYNFNRNNNTFQINWSPLSLNSTTESDVIVKNFNNTPINLSIVSGSTSTPINIEVISTPIGVRYSLQEYVDFLTKEELGAIPHIDYVGSNILDYGYITSAVQETFDYGFIDDSPDIFLDYGYITDKVTGQYVKWYEWDRNPNWYPTNHVNVYIKIEASDDAENIRNRFITQFYNLASTVLYIHKLIMCYYFGNSTINVPSGVTSLDKTPTFFGIQTTSMVSSESITFTSDPSRQHNTDNLSCITGTIRSVKNSNGLIEYLYNSDANITILGRDAGYIADPNIVRSLDAGLVIDSNITEIDDAGSIL